MIKKIWMLQHEQLSLAKSLKELCIFLFVLIFRAIIPFLFLKCQGKSVLRIEEDGEDVVEKSLCAFVFSFQEPSGCMNILRSSRKTFLIRMTLKVLNVHSLHRSTCAYNPRWSDKRNEKTRHRRENHRRQTRKCKWPEEVSLIKILQNEREQRILRIFNSLLFHNKTFSNSILKREETFIWEESHNEVIKF